MKSKSIPKSTCSQCQKDNNSTCRPFVAMTLFVLASYCTSTCHVHASSWTGDNRQPANGRFAQGRNLKPLVNRLDHRRYTGIFPRGGAVDRYRDVLQITQSPFRVSRGRKGASGVESRMRGGGGAAVEGREWQQQQQQQQEEEEYRNYAAKRLSRLSRKRIFNRLHASSMSTMYPHRETPSYSSSSLFYHPYPHHVLDHKEDVLKSHSEEQKEDDRDEGSQSDEGFFSGWKAKSWNPGRNLERSFGIHQEKDGQASSSPYILTRKGYTYDDQIPYINDNVSSHSPTEQKSGNTVIYRYFGRSVARSSKSDSIPFIVFATSTDHWKIVGKILAARGFNVMVCERTKEQKEKSSQANLTTKEERMAESGNVVVEGEALTTAVLDALKWQKAILVGCDQEASLAVEAALNLAPDRIAGLVLCGDLSDLEKDIESNFALEEGEGDDDVSLDGFLGDYVNCPCSIIWDGDASSWSTSHGQDFDLSAMSKMGTDGNVRSVIIGGGLAPHRRMPEQFAWTLTRFVENRVSTSMRSRDTSSDANEMQSNVTTKPQHVIWREILPPRVVAALDEIFAPGSLLVAGRVIATAIIYLSITRVSLFHYQNIRGLRGALVNPQNFRKLLAVPGMLLQRRMKLLPNETDSGILRRYSGKVGHLKIQDIEDKSEESDEQTLSDSTSSEIENHEETDKFHAKEEEIEPQPRSNNGTNDAAPIPPSEDLGDNEHLYKFLFFDQIVS